MQWDADDRGMDGQGAGRGLEGGERRGETESSGSLMGLHLVAPKAAVKYMRAAWGETTWRIRNGKGVESFSESGLWGDTITY